MRASRHTNATRNQGCDISLQEINIIIKDDLRKDDIWPRRCCYIPVIHNNVAQVAHDEGIDAATAAGQKDARLDNAGPQGACQDKQYFVSSL